MQLHARLRTVGEHDARNLKCNPYGLNLLCRDLPAITLEIDHGGHSNACRRQLHQPLRLLAPLPPNTRAEMRRDMARLRFVQDQIKEIEATRLQQLEQAPAEGTGREGLFHANVHTSTKSTPYKGPPHDHTVEPRPDATLWAAWGNARRVAARCAPEIPHRQTVHAGPS